MRSDEVRVADLVAGDDYRFKVQAVSSGVSGGYSAVRGITPTGPVPEAPRLEPIRVVNPRTAVLRWQSVRHAAAYVAVSRNLTTDGTWREISTRKSITGSRLEVGQLRPSSRYAFRLQSWHMSVPGCTSQARRISLPRG